MLEHEFEPSIADTAPPSPRRTDTPFTFIGERLWLDFVNTDDVRRGVRFDALREFETFVLWLEAANVVDPERAAGLRSNSRRVPPQHSSTRVASAHRFVHSPNAATVPKRHAPTRSARSIACSGAAPALDASSQRMTARLLAASFQWVMHSPA
jgi:hypothetical protein